MTIVWDEELVDEFSNADPRLADMPNEFRNANFERQAEPVADFLARTGNLADEEKERELQKHLLAPLMDTNEVGMCT